MNNDLICVGNAIIDIVSTIDDKLLNEFELVKGSMKIVSHEDFNLIFEKLKKYKVISGGSAANTAVGFSSLGGISHFLGQIGNDEFGKLFQKDINSQGVKFKANISKKDKLPSSKSMVLVSKDAERTMCTFLGASTSLGHNLIDQTIFDKNKILYLEGYLFDKAETKNKIKEICNISKINNMKISLSLSDVFCVERHKEDFLNLIENYVDILFANENELETLFSEDLKKNIFNLKKIVKIAAITMGESGSIIFDDNDTLKIESVKSSSVLDTTGAGDIYAAGFLFGISRNFSLRDCGILGSKCASSIISHYGARPKIKLKGLI